MADVPHPVEEKIPLLKQIDYTSFIGSYKIWQFS
jgi:hypothetical protein